MFRPQLVVPSSAAAAAVEAAAPVVAEVASAGTDVALASVTLRAGTVLRKRSVPVRAVLASALLSPPRVVARSSWGAVLIQAAHQRPCLRCTAYSWARRWRASSSTACIFLVRFFDRRPSGLRHFKGGVRPAQQALGYARYILAQMREGGRAQNRTGTFGRGRRGETVVSRAQQRRTRTQKTHRCRGSPYRSHDVALFPASEGGGLICVVMHSSKANSP